MAREGDANGTESRSRSFKIEERQFGDYVLGRQLGSGGMGIVYEASQVSLNRKVALKFIRDSQVASPTLLRRFTIEAEATARLHHPNIVAIHEIGEVDGQPYFSMDLVEGDSLRARMAKGDFAIQNEEGSKSNGRSQQVAIARLIAKTARSLHHAHQRGVLHRDLKPANILLDKNDEPHLTDFGLAKILRQTTEQDTRQSLTGTGDIAGTPSYMSPEQASSAEVTSAADIYGLGSVLYELLAGRPPFRGNTALETLKQVQEQPVKSPRALNKLVEKDLDTICLKCLEKDPRHRYSSAEALAEDLENWIDHKPIKARSAGPVFRATQWVKRNPTGTALIGTLFLGLAAALVLLIIVNKQKIDFETQQALLFREKVDQLSKHWADPDNRSLTIFSKDLAILGNRPPREDSAVRSLSFGASIIGDPVTFAQQRAAFFAELESNLGRDLREPVQLDLVLYKSDASESDIIAEGRVDIMIMEPTSYLEAKMSSVRIVPLARVDKQETIVVVAHTNSGLNQLSQLVGRSIAFADRRDPLTVWTKSRLVDAGVLRKDLQLATNFTTRQPTTGRTYSRGSSREIVAAVLKRLVDAGPTHLRRYEVEKHNGLMRLDSFPSTPRIIVARQGLEKEFIGAFRNALLRVRKYHAQTREELGNRFDWEETLTGAVEIGDSYLDDLRMAMRKAARFDGEPDPFPTTRQNSAADR